MMAFGDTGDIGRRTGMYMTILSIGALAGPPISGAINAATGGYKDVGVYAGMFQHWGAYDGCGSLYSSYRICGDGFGRLHAVDSAGGVKESMGPDLSNHVPDRTRATMFMHYVLMNIVNRPPNAGIGSIPIHHRLAHCKLYSEGHTEKRY